MNRLSPTIAGLALFAACAAPPTEPVAAVEEAPQNENAVQNRRDGGRSSRGQVYEFLAANYDTDKDGAITAAEYGRGERAFGNLDRNKDGVIDASDWQRNRRGRNGNRQRGNRGRGGRNGSAMNATQRLTRQRRFIEMYATFLNVDGQPGIGKHEWRQWAASMPADDDGVIATEDLSSFLGSAADGRMARMGTRGLQRDLDSDGDGDVTRADLASMFDALDTDGDSVLGRGDELRMPPGRGETAPDFTLAYADDPDRKVTLSSFRGKKPVALIFGSYT